LKRLGASLPAYLARLKAKLDAGQLGDAERAAQAESERLAEAGRQRQYRWSVQEGFLSPRHVGDAKRLRAGELHPVSEAARKLRQVLAATPAASVLLVGPRGCGKTTAATAYALARIQAGYTVRHVTESRWRRLAQHEEYQEELEYTDLVLLDQLHKLAGRDGKSMPRWIAEPVEALIDYRYERPKLQTIGIATVDVEQITETLGGELVDRFDVLVGVQEQANYRKPVSTGGE
jgi:DNA replication protein DnaC